MVLMTVMSSTIFAVYGSNSLTQVPACPCCENVNADFATGSVDCPIVCATRCPWRMESGICVP